MTEPTREKALRLAEECERMADGVYGLSAQGIAALRSAAALLHEQAEENATLKQQLPDGMKHCTIKFMECELGHGRLTATNWIEHPCPTCALAKKDAEIERLRDWIIEAGDGQFCAHECGTFLLDDDDYEAVTFDDEFDAGLLCRSCYDDIARAALSEKESV